MKKRVFSVAVAFILILCVGVQTVQPTGSYAKGKSAVMQLHQIFTTVERYLS